MIMQSRCEAPGASTVSRAIQKLLVLTAPLLVIATASLAAECSPVSTRPADSVRLLSHPVGQKSVEQQLLACRANDSGAARFAEATLLIQAGELDGAVALLNALAPEHQEHSAVLLADVLTERAGTDQAVFERAWRLYRPFADKGVVFAIEGLGVSMLKGSRDPKLRAAAVTLLRDAVGRGSPTALSRMGAVLVQTAVDPEERTAGLAALETAVAAGEPIATLELGKICFFGAGVERNYERAVNLFGALARSKEAQFWQALLWKRGWTIAQSESQPLVTESSALTRRINELQLNERPGAADRIESEKQREALQGRVKEIGARIATRWDGNLAIELLRRSAEQQFLPAITALGSALAFGRYGQFDPQEGRRWLQIAVERGDATAAERLGNLLEMKVIDPDGTSAAQYYKMAADRGHPRSVLAMDRLVDSPNPNGTPSAAALWASEMRHLNELAAGLNLTAASGDKPYRRVFARGLPEGSPYFEADRNVTFTILDASRFQIFAARLEPGERVRLDRGSGEALTVSANDDSPGNNLLGKLSDGTTIISTLAAPERGGAVLASASTLGEIGPQTFQLRASGIVFRALEGPRNAVTVHDPEFRRIVHGTDSRWAPPYEAAAHQSYLAGPKDIGIPDLPRLGATVRGGTSLEVLVDGAVAWKDTVPKDTTLYLEFSPNDFRRPTRIVWPERADTLPSEVTRRWMPRPEASMYAGEAPIGWVYARYVPEADALYNPRIETYASVLALGADMKGDHQTAFRLRCIEYEMMLMRLGGDAVETKLRRANIALSISRLERHDEAIRMQEETVDFLRRIDARPPALVVQHLLSLSTMYGEQQDLTRAIASAREALAMAMLLPLGASGSSSSPLDSRFAVEPRRDPVLPAMKDFPHQEVRRALGLLVGFYNAAQDFSRTYVYVQRLAAIDFLDNPDEETNGNVGAYLLISDLAHRGGKQRIERAAGLFVLEKAKADAGQRDKPEPPRKPIAMPPAVANIFGPGERSILAGIAFQQLGDAYRGAGRPWGYSEPLYDAALNSALGATGSGSGITIGSAAKLAFARWFAENEADNLSMLKTAASFNSALKRFPSLPALDRNVRALFSGAYLGSLLREQSRNNLTDREVAEEAMPIFQAEDGDAVAQNFDIARLKRRATSAAQRAAIENWVGARADFDRIIRRLNSDAATGDGPGASSAAWATSRAARERLTAAERVLQGALPDRALSLSGGAVVTRVQALLERDEVAVSLLPTRFAVFALVITSEDVRLRYFPIGDVQLAERIQSMRLALDPVKAVGAQASPDLQTIAIDALKAVRPFTVGLFEQEGALKRRWIVVSHGLLRNIPIEAVPIDDNVAGNAVAVVANAKSWPGLSKEIGYLPSLTALIDLRSAFPAPKTTMPIAIVSDPVLPGDPRYDSPIAARVASIGDWFRQKRLYFSTGGWLGGNTRLAPVPETALLSYEVLRILRGSADNLYSGARARRSQIESGGDLGKARVLLFATHGETAESFPQIGEPFLALTSEGPNPIGFDPLIASDISRLSIDPELVLLSACNTAAPDGTPAQTGLSGLASSFLSAGARALMITGWKVHVMTAHLAVTEALRAAKDGNAGSGEALRRARLAVASRFAHPFYWSAFIYIGDPRHRWEFQQ